MSFWFSRGFKFGPLRLNVGSGGFGVSFGFWGLRLGLNGRGVYFSASKAGFHYRRYLGGHRETVPLHLG